MARLLVIDDEKAILDLVKNGLEKDGHIVAICESAAEVAVERLPLQKQVHRLAISQLQEPLNGISNYTGKKSKT